MKLSKRTFLLLFAMIVFSMVRMRGGDQYVPLPDFPLPDFPMPDDPADPFSDPFDPINDFPLPDIPDVPPEFPLPDPFLDFPIPLPDLPGMEDPYPDLEPSLFPGDLIGDFPPPIVPVKTNVLGPHPQAVAINTVTPLMEFPRRIWFSPHVTTAGTGAGTPLNCSAQFQNRLLIPESKKNSVAIMNTCPVGIGARVPVGKKPISVVTAPDGQSALVANVDDATISVINLKSMAVSQTISLPPFNGVPMRPSGIAVLPDGSRAYVADHVALPGSAVYVIDLTTLKFSGTMLPVGDFPQSIAVTPDGSQLWVSSWGSNRVDVFDTLTNVGVAAFNVPSPNGIAFNPNGTRAYIAASGQTPGYVQVIDVQTLQTIVQIPVGSLPHAVLVSQTGRHLFVTNVLSNSISLIDTGSNTVLRTIKLRAQHPLGLAFAAKSPF
jgi:YVTN family beta-propeller protein